MPDDALESLRVDAQSEACCNSVQLELHDGRNGLAKGARGKESAVREGDVRPAEQECESDISDLAAVAASGLPEQESESDISDLAAVAASGLPDLAAVAAGGRDSQMSKQVRIFLFFIFYFFWSGLPDLAAVAEGGRGSQMSKQVRRLLALLALLVQKYKS